ncbi:MAG TPA: universal stress protein [Gemmatimonadaceae bacterium]
MIDLQLAAPLPLTAGGDAMFNRVLLGIDFGSASLAAARWATRYVALRTHAILSHVVPHAEHAGDDADAENGSGESLHQMTPALAGGLGGFAATLAAQSTRTLVRYGRPSQWLSMLADDVGADLLVLGRRADANRVRVGEPNVIERAARRTGASVLVVPEGVAQGPTHIVAAIDESCFAPMVVKVARRLARLHEVPLTILHVMSPVVGAYERVIRTAGRLLGAGAPSKSTERLPAAVPLPARIARWLDDLGRTHNVLGLDRTEVLLGDPAREITATAATREASLVVVGMRGADDAPFGSIGSVTRELLTRAPVAVLAVNGL